MPPNTVRVTRPGIYGNPFKAIDSKNREHVQRAVEYFERWLTTGEGCFECGPQTGVTMAFVPPWDFPKVFRAGMMRHLRGKNLACWCKPGWPCHAEVLLRMANGEEGSDGRETNH